MPRSAPENNTDFALIPMNDAALALSPAQRQLNAAACLFAYEDGGRRYTTLTPRKLADLTGCVLRTAQRQIESRLGGADLTLPNGRFVKLAGDDPIWQLSPRDWACAVAIRFLMESARSSATSHTTETIARYAGVSTHAVKLALTSLRAAGHIATETRFDQAAGKRRRTVKNGLAPVTRQNRANSKSNPAQNGDATKSRLLTRQNRADTHDKIAPMVRQNRANSISLFKSKQQEPAAAGNPEAKAVAAAVGISITSNPTQSQSPDDPTFAPEIEKALGRWSVTDQMAIIRAIVKHGADEMPSWLVKQLARPTNAQNLVGVAISRINQWPAVRDKELAAAKRPTAPASDDTLERHRRDREAHEAAFNAKQEAHRLELYGSWPPVPATLAPRLEGPQAIESGNRDFSLLVKVDGAWRMSPTIADKMNSRYPDPSPTYAEPPERKAALNGTDTDTSTHRNAEAFTVEAFTGNQGTEAAQPVPTPAAGSTPDAVVDTRPSLPTPQGRSSAPTTRPAVTPSGRLKSPGTGETLPQDRFAKLQAAIRDNQQKNVG